MTKVRELILLRTLRGVVHDEHDGATFRHRVHQMLDEGAKSDGVLVRAGHEDYLVCPPIVSAD